METPPLLTTRPPVGSKWSIFTDGATDQANPSPFGGWGFSVWVNDCLYFASHGSLNGNITNNLAEFKAIERALYWCHLRGLQSPAIFTDSSVAVEALNQRANIKAENLTCVLAAISMSRSFLSKSITFEHVSREVPAQRFTDFLANLGIHGDRQYKTLEQREALMGGYANW